MKNKWLYLFLSLYTFSLNAQAILGKWNSFEEKTNKVESTIEIYQKEGKIYAKIIGINDPERQNATCFRCKGKRKDQRILGMDILTGLKKKR